MELNQLECFLQVAKTEHITQAAEQLHMTQPSLSKVISRLEEDLGTKLFNREGRNIRLNEQGQVVLKYAERLLYTVGDMEAELGENLAGHSGSLRIGSSYSTQEPNWLLTCMRDFLLDRPDVSVLLQQYPADQLPQALENREVDLAISVRPLWGSNFIWHELITEPIGVIMSVHHPLANKPNLSLVDLRHERFYCNDANSDSKEFTLRCCTQAGFQPDIHFECLFPSFIGEAVSRGYGISLISELGHRRSKNHPDNEQLERKIIYRSLKEPYCRRICGVAYQEGRKLPHVTWAFYKYLLENVKPE